AQLFAGIPGRGTGPQADQGSAWQGSRYRDPATQRKSELFPRPIGLQVVRRGYSDERDRLSQRLLDDLVPVRAMGVMVQIVDVWLAQEAQETFGALKGGHIVVTAWVVYEDGHVELPSCTT